MMQRYSFIFKREINHIYLAQTSENLNLLSD